MMDLTSYVSYILMAVGVLVVITNIIVQVVKEVTYDLIPTNLLAVGVSMALTLLVFLGGCSYNDIAVTWYMMVAVVVLGFFVAFAAMFGFDKFAEALEALNELE